MRPDHSGTRRQFLQATGIVTAGVLAGCGSRPGAPTDESTGVTESPESRTSTETGTGQTDGTSATLVDALTDEARRVPPTGSGGGLDAVADDLASSPIVGVGETSHGVREFKQLPARLVRRLVRDHGYRLVAMEGTLGDFAPANDYVTGRTDDLDAAMAELEFYFWQTEGIRDLFSWLRAFNEGRTRDDVAEVIGYDAQFSWINGRAVRDYFERVDPDYLAAVADELEPLTTSPSHESGSGESTDEVESLLSDLRDRLRGRRTEYVERASESRWRLAMRHLWTLERGLRVTDHFRQGRTRRGEALRDESMAANVAWLREWTGGAGVVALGNANHTLRGYRAADRGNARMGQHLTDEFGADYYSLGLLFGDGTFAAPTDHARTEFDTFDVDGPAPNTLATSLAEVDRAPYFLDFEAASDRDLIEAWLERTESVQFTVPAAAQRGAVLLSTDPEAVMDGACFVANVTPARFTAGR